VNTGTCLDGEKGSEKDLGQNSGVTRLCSEAMLCQPLP
jgi:hypothetical protein